MKAELKAGDEEAITVNDHYSHMRTKIQNRARTIDEAIHGIAESFAGKTVGREMTDAEATRSAIKHILRYYRINLLETHFPDGIADISELLDYCVHTCGLEYRGVRLETGWYKKAYGIMIGKLNDGVTPVVLLPGKVRGYSGIDLKTGKHTKIDKRSCSYIDSEAICFYLPFPGNGMTVRDLLKYMLRQLNAADLLMFFSLAVVWSLMTVAIPILLTWIWQYYMPVGLSKSVAVGLSSIMGLTVSLSGISFCLYQLKIRIGVKININTEAAWMHRVLHMPQAFYRKFSPDELLLRTTGAKSVGGKLVETAFAVIIALLNVIALIILINRTQSAAVGVYVAVLYGCQLVLYLFIIFEQSRAEKRRIVKSSVSDSVINRMVNEMQRIRLNSAEAAVFKQWADRYSEEIEEKYHSSPFLTAAPVISIAITLFSELFLYLIVIRNGIMPYNLIQLFISTWMIGILFERMIRAYPAVSSAYVSLKLAEPILKSEPEDNSAKIVIKRLFGSIEAVDLSFRYGPEQRYVINDLSLKIAPGDFVAIVGSTGCGKSTLIRLLLGKEKPDKGMVIIDHRNIADYDPSSLRSHIGLVTKDDCMLPGTLMYNILMNALDQEEATAWKAAEAACIADDIRKMPMGMNTVVLENDSRFSAGQLQRLMIARAIAGSPEVLILDDMVSALDTITLKRLYESLAALGCTRIIISHRLSAVRYADRIVCLNNGKVAEEGTYDELIKRGGFFTEFMVKQG